MDLRRLRKGEWIAGLAGVVLLAVMPLDWFDSDEEIRTPPEFGPMPADYGSSAWEAFSILDVLMAFSALAAIGLLILVAVARLPSTGIAAQSLALLFTGVVAVLVVLRLTNLPEVAEGGAIGVDFYRTVACYLGSVAAVAIPAGLLIAMRDERLSTPGRLTDATGVPVDSQPSPEELPAPRP